ncbi:SpaA isopeptide-forming pilin-related protein [Vagococcus fluvialis]|uniref:SpaA isopeptide-forming pilin-related protein n=1 Tax=Vagococcus fluvialis TaxID=2738 RepID=UPI003D0A1997
MISCLKKGQIINDFFFLLFFSLLALWILGFTELVVYAEDNNSATDSFSGLVIDEDVLNEPDDMDVVVRNLHPNKYLISKVAYTPDTPIGNYGTGANIKTNIHSNYVKGSGKIYIGFSSLNFDETFEGVEVEVTYPHVGYMETKQLERRDIGAKLIISNIYKGHSSRNNLYSSGIDLSTNLFSGMYLDNISAADWGFEFFDIETGKIIDFSEATDEYEKSSMAFNSLNGYEEGEQAEFAKEVSGREAKVSRDSMVEKGTLRTKPVDGQSYTFTDVYHGSNNDFDDWLGSPNFHIASAQFPLEGTRNTFQIGTAYYKKTGWFSFSSAKIDAPYRHRVPVKTIQPLRQYQAGDKPNKPTGEPSGFAQRYWDDMDIGLDGKINTLDYYKVKGHNPEKPKELAEGVPILEDRFIEPGEEFYYYINQRTTNIASDGIVLPEKYIISDNLPEGIELVEEPFTLYNLDGKVLNIDNEGFDGDNSFTIDLGVGNDSNTEQINKLARQYEYYGFDFSLRVKVRATKEIDKSKLVINQAETTFVYFDTQDAIVTQKSNYVVTKLRTAKIEFEKLTQDNKPLQNAVFEIYEFDESQEDNKGKLLDTKTSNSEGQVKFNYEFSPGKYVLSETRAPGQYMPHEDVILVVDDNLQVIWPDDLDGKIINEKRYNLWLDKLDENKKPLKGAKFELSGGDLEEPRIETSDKDGKIIFRAGPLFKGQTYELRELEAPEGYDKVDTVYKIEMSEDGFSAVLIDGEGKRSPLDVEFTEDVAKHNIVSGNVELGIVNSRSKTELEVIKQDKDSKKAIKDVSFKVFKEGENPDEAVEYTTDEQGRFTVLNLDTKETYYIRETKAPNDYILLDQDIMLSFDTKQNTWLVTEKDTDKGLENVVWNSETNKLSVIIFNEQKKVLPQTGGTGIIIPLVISSLTGLGSLSYFIRFKRKEV